MRFPLGLETVVEDGHPFVALRAGDPALNKWVSPLPLRARPLARCQVLVQMQRLALAKVEEVADAQAKAQDAEDFAGQSIEEENPAEIMGLAFAPPKRRKRSKCVEMKEKIAKYLHLPKTVVLELGNWRFRALLPARKDAAATMEATSANFAFLFSLLRAELAASTPASASPNRPRTRTPVKTRLHFSGCYLVERSDLPPRCRRRRTTIYERLSRTRPPPASAQAPRERAQVYFKRDADACAFAATPADEAAKIVEARAARKEAAKACKRARGARARTPKKAARQDDDIAGTAWGEDAEAAWAEEAPDGDFAAMSWEVADVGGEANVVEEAASP